VSAQHQLEHARERLTARRDQRLELFADARIEGDCDDRAVSFGCGGHLESMTHPARTVKVPPGVFILTGAPLSTPYGFDTGLIRGLAGWSAMFTGYGFFAHFLLKSPPTPPHPPYTHIEYRYRYRYRGVGGVGGGVVVPPSH